MEDSKDKKPNYQIFTIESNCKKNVVERFYADSNKAANDYLVENYVKTVNGSKKHYWGHYSPIKVLHDDGTTTEYTCYEAIIGKTEGFWNKVKEFFAVDVAYYLWDKPKDLWYWLKDLVFLNKNKIERRASWSFDTYVLEMIEKTLPRLMEDKVGISQLFIDQAICDLHKDDASFDLAKYNEDHCSTGYPKEVDRLAEKMMEKAYNEILLHIKLYRYYSDFGVVEDKDQAFDKEWRSTLPIIEGSYDEFDYKKLQSLADQEWNAIWEMMKAYGRTMWD